ncbi:hypothetical protein QQX98_008415 [Neonectria punicea]|uniref:tyrosinase n=1 Tax=Neonectria punicea TaxID=979145 RepID=A0ABR1GVL9_9HYPO
MADPSKPGVPFGITGIPAEHVKLRTDKIPHAPGMPVRREISNFADPKEPEGKKQWTLYVLALERFKNLPVEKKLSYFQVAGIHAFPSLTWDEGEPKQGRGYCVHGKSTFPTWHRIYMLLFEQLVWKHMKAIIDEWKLPEEEDANWRKEADNWRLPYWDWARKQMYAESFALPHVLTTDIVAIYPPESKKQQYTDTGNYPNPLYGFDNPEKHDGTEQPRPFGNMPQGKEKYRIPDNTPDRKEVPNPTMYQILPWSLTNSTGRWGIQIQPRKRYSGLDGVNNFAAANEFFAAGQLGEDKTPSWLKKNPGNLSDKVNRIMTKGFSRTWGIFASTKWAEDRLIPCGYMSLESIHNTVHVGYPSFSSEAKTKAQYDDLVPDSAAVKPDGSLDEDHYTNDIEAHVNRTYPGAALVASKIRCTEEVKTPDGLPEKIGEPFPDYIINVVYDRYALGGTSYSIKLYLGGSENKDMTYFVDGNYIGEVFTFTGSYSDTEGGCQNCKRQAEEKTLSLSQIPITIPLLTHIFDKGHDHAIDNLTEDEVSGYLQLHLRWEFVQHGGHLLNEDDFPATKISVWKGTGKPRYTKPENKLEADLVSIATMPAAALAALPTNSVAHLSQKAIDSPDSRTLPPVYSAYEPVYAATHGKKWGLEDPAQSSA